MSLITCEDCGTSISDQAPACPHCGRPLHIQRVRTSEDSFLTRSRGCGDLVLYGGAILIIIILFGLRGCLAG